MKRSLLLLALLVTELGFHTAQSCPVFYGIFGALASGSQIALNASLAGVSATEEEKAAFGKIQECYNEAGLLGKLLDFLVMGTITTSSECKLFYTKSLTPFGS
ncbi:androgen-binding protein homolog [Perognathus longimembris pacificus]|uniref:androgen-binding protein homolog n=1 Tax=Perognathus longimembris pacificus TaxID=214514 RepID=UPI00201876DC|nr:androgen-binding protein homolog [Perognathus longimembris pacificus]